ncbi:MAG: hypothetical protein HYR51_01735 [Candidatus Rokubacteria bacterium]|nr:hypothetical protein [Candidatus Rokubacteria bacterium]
MSRYRFTRVWARLMVAIGIVAIALGVVSAAVALFTEEWRQGVTGTQAALERTVVVGGLVLSGFLAGSPFIVFGQLLEIFLDQRALLTRIHRQLRRGTEPAAPAARPPADRYPRLS